MILPEGTVRISQEEDVSVWLKRAVTILHQERLKDVPSETVRLLALRSSSPTNGDKKILFNGQDISLMIDNVMFSSSRTVILLGGPSNTYKTTFANYLIQLLSNQFKRKAVVLSLDRYFKPLSERPVDEDGEHEFDHPEALYLDWIEEDLTALYQGEVLGLPSYDMATRASVRHSGKTLQIKEGDVLIVDSIHALHERVSGVLRDASHVKVYLDAPEMIRLMRRILRDTRKRGENAQSVLEVWPG